MSTDSSKRSPPQVSSSRSSPAPFGTPPGTPVSDDPVQWLPEEEAGTAEISQDASEDEVSAVDKRSRPWWKKPSPSWILVIMPFLALITTGLAAPRIEIYTTLACKDYRPDHFPRAAHVPTEEALAHLGGRSAQYTSTPPSSFAFPLDRLNFSSTARSRNDTTTLNSCASDPVVQAAVARLTVLIATSTGILSCITTAWWGSFSDRHGRKCVLGISVIGLLFSSLNFIMVTRLSQHRGGSYWFFVIGPIIEGCLGGFTSLMAAVHAYLADCVDPSSRSRLFSLSHGLLFIGVALGPTLSGLFIRYTRQTLSVFYIAASMYFLYALLIWFVIPESLSPAQMNASIVKRREKMARARENPSVEPWKKIFGFLTPLSVFIPEKAGTSPLNPGRDWDLTLVAMAYGFTASLMGSYSYKFQYAGSSFGWTSEKMGYWLSLIGVTRAAYLTILLPVAIKWLKPTFVPRNPTTSSETQPLLSPPSDASVIADGHQVHHSPSFDLGLARISLAFNIVSYIFICFSPTPMAFILLGIFSALGESFSPAVQSVALESYTRRGGSESGRLFGALSVVQALCGQILGPALFGFTYMKTVATYPRAIFLLSVVVVVISFILLSFVKLSSSLTRHRPSSR